MSVTCFHHYQNTGYKKDKIFNFYFCLIHIQQTLSELMCRTIKQSKIIAVPLASPSNCVELYIIISFDDDHGKSKEKNDLRLRVVVILACFKSSKCQH